MNILIIFNHILFWKARCINIFVVTQQRKLKKKLNNIVFNLTLKKKAFILPCAKWIEFFLFVILLFKWEIINLPIIICYIEKKCIFTENFVQWWSSLLVEWICYVNKKNCRIEMEIIHKALLRCRYVIKKSQLGVLYEQRKSLVHISSKM